MRRKVNACQLESYKQVLKTIPWRYKVVLEVFQKQGGNACNFEICEQLNLTPNQVSGRLTELTYRGEIEDSGHRRFNKMSGRNQTVWKLRDKK